jgi:EmrB/QacA subfamily drug resistance transporter
MPMATPPDNSIKKAALLVATMVSFVSPFMGAASNIALPTIGKQFGMDAVVLSWVATSFLLSSAIFLVPFGRLADIFGRKRIFLWGVSIFTLNSIGCGVSASAGMLIFFRVLQGFGSSMIVGTSVAILTSVFPPGERGRALGVNVAAVYLGLSLGPFLGGFLTQQLGWQSIFLMNVPLGLIVIAITLAKLKGEWAEAKGESMDVKGSILYCIALVSLMYGLSVLPGQAGFLLIALGFAVLVGFVFWEQRAKSPVLDLGLFKNNSVFAMSNLAALINYGATFAVTFLLSLYLQYLKGFTPQQAGFILVCQPLVMAVLSPFAGRLSDRIEPRIVASIGMAITTVGLFALTFFDGNTGLPFIVSVLAVLGVGFALFSSPNTNAIMGSVDKRNLGVASAIVGTMRATGMMVSMGIAMLLFSVFIGRVQITPEHYPLFLKSAKTAFVIFTVLCFGGIFASLARGRVRS